MIVWNILGHTFLGFEQSDAATFVGLGAAIFMQFLLEWVDAKAGNREVRWAGSWANFFNALPAALIPGFACSMLLYPNERLWPIVFASALSIASKVLLRAPVGGGRTQHVFNPSNFGIAATLLLFPQVGFAPPYHFTENLVGGWQVDSAGIHFVHRRPHPRIFYRTPAAGGRVDHRLCVTGRDSLAALYGFPHLVPLMPMTSAAFIVFTLYMVPDPATTPLKPWRQAAFGFAVAMVYGCIQMLHLVFGLFFALITVCTVRGISLHLYYAFKSRPAGGGRTDSRACVI